MEVIVARSAGFCFGVEKAVKMVYDQLGKGKEIYTFGPIIHNDEVVRDLESRGVKVVEGAEDLKKIKSGTIVIRSHGVSRDIYELIREQGLECVDATCPFVKRIHHTVEKECGLGRKIIIVGNPGHPEVEGIRGWVSGTEAVVVESEEEAERLADRDSGSFFKEAEICIVAQTTFNYNKFKDIVEIFLKRGYNVSVVNTICNATEERQAEARQIASQAAVMIVIGGTHSSNTRKLYEICKEECEDTHFIQTLDDLRLELPKAVSPVGITAGASTPNNIIEEVQNYVRINF